MIIVPSITTIDEGPFVVGKEYIRPVIFIENKKLYLPYIHYHKGDISNKYHYHLDARFISNATYKKIKLKPNTIFGIHTQNNQLILAKIKCFRKYIPNIQTIFSTRQQTMYTIIENNCKNKKCQNNTCPHQGTDLSSVKSTKINGELIQVCPSHGLQWNKKTGKLMPRSKPLTIIPSTHT